MEKYTGMTLKDLGDGRWQARFSYKDGDRWKWKSRNFRAPSERAARREAAARRAELEEEAAREALPLGMACVQSRASRQFPHQVFGRFRTSSGTPPLIPTYQASVPCPCGDWCR